MAYLGNSNFQQNKEYLMGNDARPAPSMDQSQNLQDAAKTPTIQEFGAMTTGAGGGGSTSVAPALDMQTTSAPQTISTVQEKRPDGTTKTTTTDTKPVFKTTGSLNQRLQDPITQGAQQGQQRLQEASQVFQQMAGPSRTFEGIGGAQTLSGAVESGTGLEDARALVSAQYGGPAGLDQGELAELQNLQQEMGSRARALGTGGGLSTLIQQSAPGVTRGEAEFEAKRRLDESKIAGRDLRLQQVNPFGQSIVDQAQSARDFAGQRGLEEDLIQESARGHLTGRRDIIDTDLERVMEAARGQQAAGQTAYEDILGGEGQRLDEFRAASDFLRSGTAEDPGDLVGAEVAEKFNTPGYAQTQEGKALMEKIMSDPRYASIAGIDPLELGITKRGKQLYDVEGQDYRRAITDKPTRRLASQRQKELEASFGKRGQYNVTNPLYHGSQFESADPTSYLGFDPGTSPTRENMAEGEQKQQFNRINDLLGSLDKIGEKEPFRAAQIFAEANRYLENEEKALEEIGENLTENQKSWKKQVKRARKNYKKSEKNKKYAKIAGALTLAAV